MTKNKKTEHSGAKNGGGHWGPREEAKALSKKARRTNSKEIIENERQDLSKIVGSSPVVVVPFYPTGYPVYRYPRIPDILNATKKFLTL